MITHWTIPVAFANNLFGWDGVVILMLGLLIFGSRLPEAGKRLAQSIGDFKKELGKGFSGEGEDIPWHRVIGFALVILFGLWMWLKYRGYQA